MVFGLFKKKEKRNLLLDEINMIKEKVTHTENEFKNLENSISEEMRRVYGYISGLHGDIDALGEVVQEIKDKVEGASPEKMEFLERKIKDLEENLGYIRIIGKVALKNYERIDKLETKVNDALHAIDSIVKEMRESEKTIPIPEKGVTSKREQEKKVLVSASVGGATIEEPESVAEAKEASTKSAKSTKTKKKLASIGNKRDYLAELQRLRKELLELKTSKAKM